MCKRKTLKELTLKDNFMFGAVMSDENNTHYNVEMQALRDADLEKRTRY